MYLERNVCITLIMLILTPTTFQVQNQITNNTNQHTKSSIRDINLHEIDERIICILQDPDKHSSHGNQLLKDVTEFYSYLGDMTNHIDKNNNLHLLKIILTHPPEFISVPYDEVRLSKVFSWTQDQLEDFSRVFEGSFLLWKRLEGMSINAFQQ